MDNQLFTRRWWDEAGSRAANTVLAGAVPYITAVLTGEVTTLYALSALGMLLVASLATSLGGLPEVVGKVVPLWKAILSRTAKTFGQSLAVWAGGALILQELDWTVFVVTVGGPVLVTLIRTLKDYLPETAPVVVADATKVAEVEGSSTTVVNIGASSVSAAHVRGTTPGGEQ